MLPNLLKFLSLQYELQRLLFMMPVAILLYLYQELIVYIEGCILPALLHPIAATHKTDSYEVS